MDAPSLTVTGSADNEDQATENVVCLESSASSASTSMTNSFDDSKGVDEEAVSKCDVFMKNHVSQLFSPNKELSNDSKQLFGEFCLTSDGRRAFAKYVDNYRCHSLEVSETTFYNLAQSFALVLFECDEADDFLPAKSLMNMSFTYYHYPIGSSMYYKQNFNQPFELKSPDMKEFTNHLSSSEDEVEDTGIFPIRLRKRTKPNGSNSDFGSKNNLGSPTDPDKSVWKSANNWFNKELSIYKQFFKDFPGVSKQNDGKELIKDGTEESTKENAHTSNGHIPNGTSLIEETKMHATSDKLKTEKIYIYQALRYQPIWRSLRFWNAAFFDAVNTERQLHCSKLQWNSLSSEEKESSCEVFRNLTFAHLGSFIVNMKHLGIGKETCLQFLRKQSVIGNLSKDLYQLLRTQIETPLNFSHET